MTSKADSWLTIRNQKKKENQLLIARNSLLASSTNTASCEPNPTKKSKVDQSFTSVPDKDPLRIKSKLICKEKTVVVKPESNVLKRNRSFSQQFRTFDAKNPAGSGFGKLEKKAVFPSNSKPTFYPSIKAPVSQAASLHSFNLDGKVLSEEQKKLFQKILQGESLFFTGSAGSGKSFVLRYLIRYFRNVLSSDKIAVTASTGLAAHSISGMSFHSFAGIGLGQYHVDSCVKMVKKNSQSFFRWKKVELIIIDEVSMIDGDYFDQVNEVAQRIRGINSPFGGVQVILCGDFMQLPPIQKGSKFIFESKAWKELNLKSYQLNTVFRQKDPRLLKALNEVRNAQVSDETDEYLKSFAIPKKNGEKPTCLFPRRADVDAVNQEELNILLRNNPAMIYEAIDNIPPGSAEKQLNEALLALKKLTLSRGAQVMIIKNIPQKRLFNGQIGIVKLFEQDVIHVSFNEGDLVSITRELFTIDNGKVVNPSRLQFPLVLSYAMSIHKSQGQSLDSVKVDLKNVFENGQTYVALSRCTSTQRLQILNFDRSKLKIDQKVLEFQKTLFNV